MERCLAFEIRKEANEGEVTYSLSKRSEPNGRTVLVKWTKGNDSVLRQELLNMNSEPVVK